MSEKFITALFLIFAAFFIGTLIQTSYAGSLTPAVGPASTMYTLGDVYTKIANSTTTATEGSASFTTPGSVSATFHTLKEIYELIPTIDTNKVLTGTTYLGVAGSATFSLLKTGQTFCYDDSGATNNVVPCAGTGQDGDLQKGFAMKSYTDNGNGTVTDNNTGLIWQKDDDLAVHSFQEALSLCNSNAAALPGSTWRMPNINELQSIVDYTTSSPAINFTYFPLAQSDNYWSSTTFSSGLDTRAWYINFGNGNTAAITKSASMLVRCVRG